MSPRFSAADAEGRARTPQAAAPPVCPRASAAHWRKVSYRYAEPASRRCWPSSAPAAELLPRVPFHHLQTDGLWVVRTSDGSHPGRCPSASCARRARRENSIRRSSVRCVTTWRCRRSWPINCSPREFPESLHAEICEAAGLDLDALESGAARSRGAALARRVLLARSCVSGDRSRRVRVRVRGLWLRRHARTRRRRTRRRAHTVGCLRRAGHARQRPLPLHVPPTSCSTEACSG